MSSEPGLRIVPLGGLGRVGGNMMAYETPDDLILVDCGFHFPGQDQPGVDYLIPDVSYVLGRRNKLRAIVLTHGHEDHIGALPYVLPKLGKVPVYGTPFTRHLVTRRLSEHPDVHCDLRPLRDHETLTLGGFSIYPMPVTHSIADAVALAISTPLGKVIHTGDFKVDEQPLDGRHFDRTSLKEQGDAGVLVLLSDSTNSERQGTTPSEHAVGQTLHTLIAEAPYRVVLTTFASNIYRVQSVISAAEAANRVVLLAGRSMREYTQMALEQGYLKARPGTIQDIDAFNKYSRNRVVILASGTQGEEASAMTRLSKGEFSGVRLEAGDRVILSSRKIPGNEMNVGAVINNLYERDLDVIEDRDGLIHASGHAQNDEQRIMLDCVRPRFFVPIHGEYRHLVRHRRLAIKAGVPAPNCHILQDGNTLEFFGTPGAGRETMQVRRGVDIPVGLICVDGSTVGDVDEVVLRDRRLLAEVGVAFCTVVQDPYGEIISGPDVQTRGIVHEELATEFLERLEDQVEDAMRVSDTMDPDKREIEIKAVMRRFLRAELNRKPLVLARVIVVDR